MINEKPAFSALREFTNKMGSWNKFLLLTWKNWLLQWRRPIQTIVEIIAPVVFSIILVIIRSLVEPEVKPPITFSPFDPLGAYKLQDIQYVYTLKYKLYIKFVVVIIVILTSN